MLQPKNIFKVMPTRSPFSTTYTRNQNIMPVGISGKFEAT
jgi:hypothetical protein